MLIMAGEYDDVSAALVDVDEGPLCNSTIHITELAVIGDKKCSSRPYLSPISESRALLYFARGSGMWHCDIDRATLNMQKLATEMPAAGGFNSLPIRVSERRLLVAGAFPYSRDITLVISKENPRFEKIADIPGPARDSTSAVLVEERVMVGFGGHDRGYLNDLWIFDLQTCKSSTVRRKGNWHPGGWHVPLVVQNGTLYLVGGEINCSAFSLTLASLASLIRRASVRRVFCFVIGVPFNPGKQMGREILEFCNPTSL